MSKACATTATLASASQSVVLQHIVGRPCHGLIVHYKSSQNVWHATYVVQVAIAEWHVAVDVEQFVFRYSI